MGSTLGETLIPCTPHFIDENTETQGRGVICPVSLCDGNSNKSLGTMKNLVIKNHLGISFGPTLPSHISHLLPKIQENRQIKD